MSNFKSKPVQSAGKLWEYHAQKLKEQPGASYRDIANAFAKAGESYASDFRMKDYEKKSASMFSKAFEEFRNVLPQISANISAVEISAREAADMIASFTNAELYYASESKDIAKINTVKQDYHDLTMLPKVLKEFPQSKIDAFMARANEKIEMVAPTPKTATS